MEEYILLIVFSAALLLLSGVIAVLWSAHGRHSRWRLISVPVLVVMSIAVLRFPLFARGYGNHAAEGIAGGALHSIISGMQTVGLNASLSELIQMSAMLWGEGSGLYDLYAGLQYVCAPLICGFTLVRVLVDLSAMLQIRLCRRPAYLFSRLTEEAVIFAQSIESSAHHAGRRRPLICFCSADEEGDHKAKPYWQRARETGAIAIEGRLSVRLFPRGARHVTCVLCSPDESENIMTLSRLLREEAEDGHARRQSVKHFVFGTSAGAEQAVDALAESFGDDPSRLVFLLNPKENLAAHILSQYPLNAYCGRWEDGRARLNVLVVGSTPLADCFLRAAYACGQLCDCELNITLAAQDAKAYRERLLLSAPMLAREDHPLIRDCGALRFVQLEQNEEAAAPALLSDMDYIFLALEEDGENAILAGRIASVIDRQKLTDERRAQQRVAVVYAVQDEGLGKICRAMDERQEGGVVRPCERIHVGSRESCYQVDVMLEHELLHRAFFVSLAYNRRLEDAAGQEPEQLRRDFVSFMKKAYGRRSSMACAIQMAYYRQMMQRGGEQTTAQLADAEHRRWSAYTIMDGYDEPTREELAAYLFRSGNTHRSDALKLHPCLVSGRTDDFERLQADLDGMLLARIGNPEKGDDTARMQKALHTDYRAHDAMILSCTERILGMAADRKIVQALQQFWQ